MDAGPSISTEGPITIRIESAYRGDIISLTHFDDVPTVLVLESRTCQAGHRPTCETLIARSFQPNPIHGTRLGIAPILSLYCTSYTDECILIEGNRLRSDVWTDNGCDRREFLFGRTIIATEHQVCR
jgi:hypothetical protein